MNAIRGPLSIAAADEDGLQPIDTRYGIEKALKNNGYPYQITVYSHVFHGFAVRRAITTKAEIFSKKGAFTQASEFFPAVSLVLFYRYAFKPGNEHAGT